MLEFLRENQSIIMYVLSVICGMIAIFACVTRYPSKLRKAAQLVMALSAMLLLLAENLGELYYGNTTPTGFWMVRICNFLVFFMTLMVIQAFTVYLMDMFRVDLQLPVPKRLWLAFYLICAGEVLIIISQFTGLYYTFDAMNCYHRAPPGYYISYIAPFATVLILFTVILGYRRVMRPVMWTMMLLFTIIPVIASIVQMFLYGIYLTEMATVGMVVVLYVFILADTNRTLEQAQKREVQILKDEQEHIRKLFSQTAVALAGAIDAKDTYTQGHSARVADYSRRIAAISGKNEKECDDIYYAALLHDVGKIGIPDDIINKEGKLTAEEYEMIKSHPAIGDQILSEISDYPDLRTAARYHHERIDGAGYPDGLAGEQIPELARIISVADAYDAMTSNRSYRRPLPQEAVREELLRCAGTQFDPAFARIMVRFIDQDKEYMLREH